MGEFLTQKNIHVLKDVLRDINIFKTDEELISAMSLFYSNLSSGYQKFGSMEINKMFLSALQNHPTMIATRQYNGLPQQITYYKPQPSQPPAPQKAKIKIDNSSESSVNSNEISDINFQIPEKKEVTWADDKIDNLLGKLKTTEISKTIEAQISEPMPPIIIHEKESHYSPIMSDQLPDIYQKITLLEQKIDKILVALRINT